MPRSWRRGRNQRQRQRQQQRQRFEYPAAEGSPPPAYTEENNHQPPSPSPSPLPPYSNEDSNERTPLLRTPVIVIRQHTEHWNTWREPDRRQGSSTRRGGSCWNVRVSSSTARCTFSAALIACVVWTLYAALSVSFGPGTPAPVPTYKVAIIGAGPAGIAAAQQLRSSPRAGDVRFDITVFEAAPLVGGQLALNDSGGGQLFPHDDPVLDPVTAEDVAGTALLWGNSLFTKDSEGLLGDEVEFSELGSQQVAYYSGEDAIAQTTRPYAQTPYSSWLGQVWRYGKSVWRAPDVAKEGRLRDRMLKAPLVPDMAKVLESLDLLQAVQKEATSALAARGVVDPYVTEILEPQVRRALRQRPSEISHAALALALAQEDTANAYVGGDLLERLDRVVRSLKDVHLRTRTRVAGLKYLAINEHGEAPWLVEHGGPGASPDVDAFDKVILAAPDDDLLRGISRHGTAETETEMEIESTPAAAYRRVHVTFFTASERSETFGDAEQVLFVPKKADGKDGDDGFYDDMQEFEFVRQIARLRDDGDDGDDEVEADVEYLYRILSYGDVTEHLLRDPTVTWVHQEQLSHPLLLPLQVSAAPRFKYSDMGLWCTSVIHRIGNTVDLSWLAGKIVAEDLIKDVTTV